jgi:DNA (cytosine-5)-methyltransferase 1
LQGFPESFITNAVSDGQAYKQFGNSVCVPVIRAVANQIVAAVDAATLVKDLGAGKLKKKKTRKQIDLFVEE